MIKTESLTVELVVPEEPPAGSVVLSKNGQAWQRFGDVWSCSSLFAMLGSGVPWVLLLAKSGPLRILHWADEPVKEESA